MKCFVAIVLSAVLLMTIALGFNAYHTEYVINTQELKANVSKTENSESNLKDGVDFDIVDIDYFNDALFIGDSRTVGLGKYTSLSFQTEADFFAQTGLSAISALSVDNGEMNEEDVTLLQKLQSKTYGKIYIMFGVNEITNDLQENFKVFSNLLETVRRYQPNALIFIEANLHVGKNRSESFELYSNARLEEYNQMLSSLADDKSIYYLNLNEVYDDEEGNLSEVYTADELHLNSDCYDLWVEYLKNHAITK